MSVWRSKNGVELKSSSATGIVDGLMKARGFDPFDPSFAAASLSDLSDPTSLGDGASLAADIMIGCRGKNTAVIGDYDADGIISSVIVRRAIESLGGQCSVFLPSRWKHGYGLNDRTVADFKDRLDGKRPDVLFVVDCGSSSEEYISGLKAFGIGKIVIIDHHIVNPSTMSRSADAHVNWRQFGTSKDLCAAGEVFQVARLALSRVGKDWEWALPFAAMATVGDSVPLTGDNRIIVRNGADRQRMMSAGSPGLESIVSKRCSGGVSQKNLSFYVVPRINAAGRVSDPDMALDFLLEKDSAEASRMMMSIEAANEERKKIQEKIFRSGISMVGGQYATPPFVFLHSPEWSIGVCGISCSQMVEKYGVPAMMFGTYDGKIKGSGRSVPGVNIKAILDECGDEVFEKYGGHEMACGATVRGGMFFEAQMRFAAALSKVTKGNTASLVSEYDCELEPSSITHDLGNCLFETLYPYCPSINPEPVFKICGAKVRKVTLNQYRVYSKLDLSVEKNGKRVAIQMSAFLKRGIDDEILSIKEGDVADFYFSFPQKSYFGFDCGSDEYSLELVDVEKAL